MVGPRSRRSHPQSGFSLAEMLMVIGIIGLLLGISSAVFLKLSAGYELPAAKSKVMSLIRAARNYSRSSGLPSQVLVEPDYLRDGEPSGQSRITAFGFETVAAFHFERVPVEDDGFTVPPKSELRGAFNERGEVQGRIETIPGMVGQALWFRDDGASVVLDENPRHYSPRGFSMEAWVYFLGPPLDPRDEAEKNDKKNWIDPRRETLYTIVTLQGSYELGLLGDGGVYVQIGPDELSAVSADESEYGYRVLTAGGDVVASRWSFVHARYDGIELVIEVDGVARAWAPEDFERIHPEDWPPFPPRVARNVGSLSISRPDRFFMGYIDEPKIRVALVPQVHVLEGNVRILGGTRTLHFDTRGSLDPLRHVNPFLIQLTNRGVEERTDEEGGTTVVVSGNGEGATDGGDEETPEEEETEGKKSDAQEVKDVLEALAQFQAEKMERLDSQLIDVSDDMPVMTPGAEGEQVEGKIETIIIDLTGTIRG